MGSFARIPSPFLLIFLLSFLSFSRAASSGARKDGLVLWRRTAVERFSSSSSSSVNKNPDILAANRTRRQDPFNGYKYYTGGWNISNAHYWTSVAFTAAPFFIASIAWFVVFALVMLLMCLCFCCCRREKTSYSRFAYACSLILLIIFTLAAAGGCAILYTGQQFFHHSTTKTLDYVAGQADLTVENLRNLSNSLAAAKTVKFDQTLLPADVHDKIEGAQQKLNWAANFLTSKTKANSKNIRQVLDVVGLNLIVLAAAMLVLAFLGFLFSVCGLQLLVHCLLFCGWILITATLVLSGVFLLFHNVVADTCEAMDEWVARPQAHTALDDILPCVDPATSQESMYRSKEVTYKLINTTNTVIGSLSNADSPAILGPPLYYNQSGPKMPLLCNPYNAGISNHNCAKGEVSFKDASKVWKGFVCKTKIVNGADICATTGRVTQKMYDQLVAAASVSEGLYYHAPFLTELQDCTFVRETFTAIRRNNCPELATFSRWIYIGLATASGAVMLSLVFWVIYARERRHRKDSKQFLARAAHAPLPLRKAY